MIRDGLSFLTLTVVFALLLHSGCQGQAKAPEKPTGALEKPEPPDLQEGVENVLQTNHPAPEIT
ncbi:MAG: hypothetical protein ACYTBV_17030, partial [Planctomycetota bacterium]